MELLLGLIILAWAWIASAPASNCLREGNEHYWKCRQQQKEHWCQEAKKLDCYYDPIIGSINENFYGDGSLKFDVTTCRRYEKGQYYCRADGVNAGYRQTSPTVQRPPK